MKVIIIGGGPAGMMAAISCKKNNPSYDVVILEKNNTLGRRLLITGKGRCNITSSLEISDFILITLKKLQNLFTVFLHYMEIHTESKRTQAKYFAMVSK